MRTEDDMTEMTGNPLIRENLDFRTMGPPKPPTTRKHPIKVLERQGWDIVLGCAIFESGLDLALQANRGRRDRNGRESIDTRKP